VCLLSVAELEAETLIVIIRIGSHVLEAFLEPAGIMDEVL